MLCNRAVVDVKKRILWIRLEARNILSIQYTGYIQLYHLYYITSYGDSLVMITFIQGSLRSAYGVARYDRHRSLNYTKIYDRILRHGVQR